MTLDETIKHREEVAEQQRLKEQEPCDDEYIKVPKKALRYRTAGMVAYNVEWLKNHFDIERAVICGKQQPYEDCISRQAAIDALSVDKELLSRVLDDINVVGADREKYSWGIGLIKSNIEDIKELPSVQPEIIRCKDCRYNNDCEIQYSAQSGDEFFCGCAERKDNG